jgi:MFS family permease
LRPPVLNSPILEADSSQNFADLGVGRTRWIGLLSFDIYLFWFSLYLFVPILSVYARSVGASLSMVGLIVSSYGLTQLLVRIPIGMLSDHLGRRRPFVTAAFIIVVVSVVGLALSPNPT